MTRIGAFFFKYRDFLFPAVFIALVILTPPESFLGSPSTDVYLDALGILLVVAGQALRIVVIGLAYIVRGGKNKQVYATKLVQQGIFAHSRNPMYVGNLTVLAGLMLIHNSFWMYVIGVPFFMFAYLAITAAEEEFLLREFGAEYDEYCKRVPRFWPRMRGLRQTLKGMRFDWPKVVRKEYGTFFGNATATIFVLMRQYIGDEGWRDPGIQDNILGIVWLVVLCAWVVARVMKKTGALGSRGSAQP